jgi:plastocyanin
MRRLRQSFLAIALVAVAALVTGCGGGGGGQQTTTTDDAETASAPDPSTFGSLTVTANFEGEAPEPTTHDASANPECGTDEIVKQPVKVSDGKLKDVVVSVESGPSGFEVDSPEATSIDQENCKYEPHVLAMKTGQTLNIQDSDQGMHNVRGTRDGSQVFNYTTFQDGTKEHSFGEAGVYKLVCNVHPWMSAWVYVTEHGKASVTGESGQATLSDLPPGDYEITLWHETLGSQTQSVTIGEQEEASLDVTFSNQG